jgi:hypothetical protein
MSKSRLPGCSVRPILQSACQEIDLKTRGKSGQKLEEISKPEFLPVI